MLFPGSKQGSFPAAVAGAGFSTNPHLSHAQRSPRVWGGLKSTHLFQHGFHQPRAGLISLSLPICRRVFRDAQGTLHIRAAVPEDAGNYSCYASSALGWDEQVVTLEFTGTCSPSGGILRRARAQS